MKRLLLVAAVMAATCSPALAQTKTGDYVQRDTRISGDIDGKVTVKSLGKTLNPPVPSGTTLYGPCEGRPAHTYRIRAACEPVVVTPPPVVEEPPVVTPPPVVEPTPEPAPTYTAILTPEGESFLQNDVMGVGLADTASIGTVTNTSPKGIRTDVEHGYQRLGMFGRTGSDVILIDAAIGGGTMYVNGVSHTAMRLRGYYGQMPGKFSNPTNWSGVGSGIAVKIVFGLNGKELTQRVTFTNTTSKAAMVQYQWSSDPDQKDANLTTQKVTKAGTVESTLENGAGVYYLTTAEPGAYITRAGTFTFREIGDTIPVGTVRKADEVVQLVFPAKLLQPGESWTIDMAQGLR